MTTKMMTATKVTKRMIVTKRTIVTKRKIVTKMRWKVVTVPTETHKMMMQIVITPIMMSKNQ